MEENLITNEEHKHHFWILIGVAFLTAVVLIMSSYAWFYSSLDVRINFFKFVVSDESGLFISLDGVNFSDTIEISKDSIIDGLSNTYPNHTNQWASNGLYGVSTIGIPNSNTSKFRIFGNARLSYKLDSLDDHSYLHAREIKENNTSTGNMYLAFDVFLKNVSGSPYHDNLYLSKGTDIYSQDESFTDSDGTINSTRIGIVKVGTVPPRSTVDIIQNIECNNNCSSIIYEPNSTKHSIQSINRSKKYDVNLENGKYTPTFAVIEEGNFLDISCGQSINNPIDEEHFALQKTITDLDTIIFPIANGITKARIYVWVEGQDMDSLESRTEGTPIAIIINFYKDLAGYF